MRFRRPDPRGRDSVQDVPPLEMTRRGRRLTAARGAISVQIDCVSWKAPRVRVRVPARPPILLAAAPYIVAAVVGPGLHAVSGHRHTADGRCAHVAAAVPGPTVPPGHDGPRCGHDHRHDAPAGSEPAGPRSNGGPPTPRRDGDDGDCAVCRFTAIAQMSPAGPPEVAGPEPVARGGGGGPAGPAAGGPVAGPGAGSAGGPLTGPPGSPFAPPCSTVPSPRARPASNFWREGVGRTAGPVRPDLRLAGAPRRPPVPSRSATPDRDARPAGGGRAGDALPPRPVAPVPPCFDPGPPRRR